MGRGRPLRAQNPQPTSIRPLQRRRDLPGPSVETAEQILDWVAKDGETALHPSCTCKMGTGPDAVLDPTSMSVHGLERLRVVDASAMPYVTNGQHLRPGGNARREGRRPNTRQRAIGAIQRPVLSPRAHHGRAPARRRSGPVKRSPNTAGRVHLPVAATPNRLALAETRQSRSPSLRASSYRAPTSTPQATLSISKSDRGAVSAIPGNVDYLHDRGLGHGVVGGRRRPGG